MMSDRKKPSDIPRDDIDEILKSLMNWEINNFNIL